jgi:hypothetical protein
MNALEAAALIGALTIPFHLLLQELLRRFPDEIRKVGVRIADEAELEGHGEVIGSFCGRDIYAWVRYLGMTYRFDCALPRPRSVRERELLLEPGLVYVAD